MLYVAMACSVFHDVQFSGTDENIEHDAGAVFLNVKVETGSMAAAKAAGKVRMEGKDYIMADGDVVEFRFNV
ncbi:hypothetical protein NCAST_23_01360 [Nocardia asteroides NBRC 15531]|uniref:YchF C-terminal domain-containing protein n=1 Tax=Nocardia asteroides NBRC 15531 TaxID=1110697 RepID=U5ED48_NOCAS|nr:hypothetical protein NCAST_23_01360 [Nocardia asteroides NBRC 15531]